MSIQDFLNPLTISSTPNNITKQRSQEISNEKTTSSAFTQNLQQAMGSTQTCEASTTDTTEGGGLLSGNSLVGGVVDIGLGLATGNVLSSGISSAAMLKKLMGQDFSNQFTQLGLAVAGNFLAGLAGQDSATEVASNSAVSKATESVGNSLTELSEESVAKTKEVVAKATEASNINRTINWPIQNMPPQALLKDDKQKS